MVGTAEKYVGDRVCRSVKKRDGENFPVMVSWPPARTGARKLTQMALT